MRTCGVAVECATAGVGGPFVSAGHEVCPGRTHWKVHEVAMK